MDYQLKTSITECPGCGASLVLPGDFGPIDDLECPACNARFALASVVVRDVVTARIAPSIAPSIVEESPQISFDGIEELTSTTIDRDPSEPPLASQAASTVVDFDLVGADALMEPPAETTLAVPTNDAEPEWLPLSETVTFEPPAAEEPLVQTPDESLIVSESADAHAFAPPIADPLDLAAEEHVDPSAATVAISPESTVRLEDYVPPDVILASTATEHSSPTHETPSHEFDGGLYDYPDDDEAADDGFDLAPTLDFNEAASDVETNVERNAADFDDHQFDLRPAPRQRLRRPSAVRSLVGIVGGGAIGLFLAGYALLWLKGANADFFQMSQWLPQAMLPPSMRSASNDLSPREGQTGASQSGLLANTGSGSPLNPASGDGATPRGDAPTPTDTPPNDQAPAQVASGGAMQVDAAVVPASATDSAGTATPSTSTSPKAPANQKWPTTPIVGALIQPRLYSLEELSKSARAAENAGRRFVAGDLARPDSVRDMGQAYILLCAAAERMTLTDPAAYSSSMFTQQALAKKPMNLTAGNAARRHDLSVIAARWLQHDHRQNNGTLFVGKVLDLKSRGAWTEYTIEIAFGDQMLNVPVLMDKLRFSSGDEAAIAGVIVVDPQKKIAGYQGDAPQVVVAGYAFDPHRYANVDASQPAPDFELPEK